MALGEEILRERIAGMEKVLSEIQGDIHSIALLDQKLTDREDRLRETFSRAFTSIEAVQTEIKALEERMRALENLRLTTERTTAWVERSFSYVLAAVMGVIVTLVGSWLLRGAKPRFPF